MLRTGLRLQLIFFTARPGIRKGKGVLHTGGSSSFQQSGGSSPKPTGAACGLWLLSEQASGGWALGSWAQREGILGLSWVLPTQTSSISSQQHQLPGWCFNGATFLPKGYFPRYSGDGDDSRLPVTLLCMKHPTDDIIKRKATLGKKAPVFFSLAAKGLQSPQRHF